MSSPCSCCGCVLQDDYGTSLVTGDGSHLDPFVVEVVDPSFLRPAVRLADSEVVPANVPTIISWAAEVFDTAAMWSAGVPTSIIMPQTGIYMMGAAMQVGGVTQTLGLTMELLKNGTAIHTHIFSAGEGFELEGNTSYVFYFSAGDTLQLRVTHHHSGGGREIFSIMWACYLGRGPV